MAKTLVEGTHIASIINGNGTDVTFIHSRDGNRISWKGTIYNCENVCMYAVEVISYIFNGGLTV